MLLSKLVPAALLGAIVVMGNAFAFEPIDYPGSNPSIHLSLLGRYGGDAFSRRSVEGPPAYDPQRNRLYWIRQNEQRIDVVDIADPSRPRKDFAIDLGYPAMGRKGSPTMARSSSSP